MRSTRTRILREHAGRAEYWSAGREIPEYEGRNGRGGHNFGVVQLRGCTPSGLHNFGVERALLIMSRTCPCKTLYGNGMTLTEFRLTADLLDVNYNSRQSEELIVNRAMCY